MPAAAPILETSLARRRPDRQGKVRDIYEFGDRLVIVATDRISAFDYVLGSGVPDKGKVLTQMSAFWFDRTRHLVDNHLVSMEPAEFPESIRGEAKLLRGRSMLVTRTVPVPIECVARGYLSGSAWKEYVATGEVCGHLLPPGLRDSDPLPAISSARHCCSASAGSRCGSTPKAPPTPNRAALSSPTPSSSSACTRGVRDRTRIAWY